MDKFQIMGAITCVWLVVVFCFVTVHSGFMNKVLFKVIPLLLAIWFGFLALGAKL